MPLTAAEKEAIVSKVVEILRDDNKHVLIAALRAKVMDEAREGESPDGVDDAVYAVVQAIEELYG